MHNKVIMGHVKDFQNQLNNMFPESNWISIQRVLEEVLYEIDPNEKFGKSTNFTIDKNELAQTKLNYGQNIRSDKHANTRSNTDSYKF